MMMISVNARESLELTKNCSTPQPTRAAPTIDNIPAQNPTPRHSILKTYKHAIIIDRLHR